MSTTISLEGLLSVGGNEERALADVKVTINDVVYDWKIFIPSNANLSEFLEQSKDKIVVDILNKENQWKSLEPKTKNMLDPLTDEEITISIEKNEIVKPDIPDYYALRRNEYPPLAEQLDAIWKGVNSPDYIVMMQKIQNVKQKYPKI